MPDGRTVFKAARRSVEAGGHWLGFLFHVGLGLAALALTRHVLSHSPIVHGLAAVLRSWLKTIHLSDVLKSLF